MAKAARIAADWRDAAAYAALTVADRSLFAWEWLRRDRVYQRASALAARDERGQGPERFGLIAFEAAGRAVPDARPMWAATADVSVASVDRAPAQDAGDCLKLGNFAHLVTRVETAQADHLLLSDGLRTVRLDGPEGIFDGSSFRPRFEFTGVVTAARPLLNLRRLLALTLHGRFSRQLHRPEPSARRWILLLRAADALAAGASQRTIAATLLNASAGEKGWRSRDPSLRLQAQRLVQGARVMSAGGYRRLLR